MNLMNGNEARSSPVVGGLFIDDQNSVVTNSICRVLRQELNYQFVWPDGNYTELDSDPPQCTTDSVITHMEK